MANIPHVSFRIFSNRGLLYTDPTTGQERLFEPLEATPSGGGVKRTKNNDNNNATSTNISTNCLFESLALIGSDAFRISDHSLLREMVANISFDWYDKKLYGGIVEKLFEVHYLEGKSNSSASGSNESQETFPEYVDSKIRSEGQFGTEFDMLLISLVMNVNVRCIFNESKGFMEHDSREVINDLITTLEEAGIDTSAYDGALSKNAVDLWIYGHQHGFPMDPENMEKLNHFCALKPKLKLIDANTRQLAYRGAMVEKGDAKVTSKRRKAGAKAQKQAAILKTEPKKQKRRRLTMKEQYDIVQIFDENPNIGHKEVAEQYGIARTTVSTVLKRKDLIKMEIGIALVRDKKYQANTCRRIFTSDYSQYKAIDWALYDWMQQTSKESKDQNFSSDILKQKALHFAEKAGITDFHASEGWLNGFKNRFGMSNVKKRGRSKSKGTRAADFPGIEGEIMPMLPPDVEEELDAAGNSDDVILKKAKLNVTSHTAAVLKSKATSGRRGRPPKNEPRIPDEEVNIPHDVAAALEVVRKFADENTDEFKIHTTLNVLERKLKNQQRKNMEEGRAAEAMWSEVGDVMEEQSHADHDTGGDVADDVVGELALKPDASVELGGANPLAVEEDLSQVVDSTGETHSIMMQV